MLWRARLSIWVITNEAKAAGGGLSCQGCRAVPASTRDMLQLHRLWQLPAHREGLALSHLLALAAAEGKLLFLGLGFFFSPLFYTRPILALVAKALLAPKKNFWFKTGISN